MSDAEEDCCFDTIILFILADNLILLASLFSVGISTNSRKMESLINYSRVILKHCRFLQSMPINPVLIYRNLPIMDQKLSGAVS